MTFSDGAVLGYDKPSQMRPYAARSLAHCIERHFQRMKVLEKSVNTEPRDGLPGR
jgi:hypothetical protein